VKPYEKYDWARAHALGLPAGVSRELLIHLAMKANASEGDTVWRSERTLARELGKDRTTIIRAVNAVKAAGLIEVTKDQRHGARWIHNVYRPCFEVPAPLLTPGGECLRCGSDSCEGCEAASRHATDAVVTPRGIDNLMSDDALEEAWR
jgi:biotin operon repressor